MIKNHMDQITKTFSKMSNIWNGPIIKLYKEVPKSKETRVLYIWLLDNKTYRLVLPRPLTFDPAGVRVVHRYGVQSVTVRVIISTVYRIDYFNDFVLYFSVTCMHDHSNLYGIT